MTYWIIHENGAVPYDSIVKARAAAVRMLENNPAKYKGKGGVQIFASRNGKPEGIVYHDYKDHYSYGHKDKVYGWTTYILHKNGKIVRW